MLKSLINLLYPEMCPGCDGVLPGGGMLLCATCLHDMPYTRHHKIADNETYKRFYGRLPLEHASSLVYFHKEGIVQQLIHQLKYKGRQDVGGFMGQWGALKLKEVDALRDITDIIPVPLHPKKLKERGYNQVAAFGQALAKGLGAAYTDDVLIRTSYTKTQTKKNLEARAAIIGSAFDVQFKEQHYNRHFLLIDDVVTTGATLESCGRALLTIPGAKLSIVTIAYAHS